MDDFDACWLVYSRQMRRITHDVRVDRAYYRWQPQKPFFILSFTVLEPEHFAARKVSGRLYCTEKCLWKLNWFLRDFG